eukprot:scaffold9604_cov186-Alexandrium_tamarense.AAC.4
MNDFPHGCVCLLDWKRVRRKRAGVFACGATIIFYVIQYLFLCRKWGIHNKSFSLINAPFTGQRLKFQGSNNSPYYGESLFLSSYN